MFPMLVGCVWVQRVADGLIDDDDTWTNSPSFFGQVLDRRSPNDTKSSSFSWSSSLPQSVISYRMSCLLPREYSTLRLQCRGLDCAYVNVSTPASCLTSEKVERLFCSPAPMYCFRFPLIRPSTHRSNLNTYVQVFHKRQFNHADDLAPTWMCGMTRSSGTGQVSTDIIRGTRFTRSLHDPDATMLGAMLVDLNHASPSTYSIPMFRW